MEILLTTSQAASLLQVHESSVKRWSNAGRVAPAKTTGGHRRITLSALLELAKEQLLEIVQEQPLAQIYVKSLAVAANDA